MKYKKDNFIVILVFLILLIMIGTLMTTLFINDNNIIKLSLFIVCYMLITVVYIMKEKKQIISVKTIFLGLYTIMFGLSPIFYYFKNKTFFMTGDKNLTYQFKYCIFGYVLMLIGFYIISSRNKKYKTYDDYESRKTFSYILLIVSFAFNCIYIFSNINLFFGGNLSDGRITALTSNGIILVLTNFYLFGIAMLYDYTINTHKSKKIFYFFVLANTIFFLLRGSRSQIVNIFVVIVLIRNFYYPIPPKRMLNLFIIFLLGISLLQVIRNTNSNTTASLINSTYDTLQVGAINFNYIHNTFPEKTDYQYGKIYLINLKMMLPGPDEDFTLWLKNVIGIKFSGGGVTPTVVGEGYINAGVPGVAIIMIITGLIGGYFDKLYKNDKQNLVWIVCLLCYLISIFRGGYANIEIGLLQTSFTYCMFNLLNKKERKINVKN